MGRLGETSGIKMKFIHLTDTHIIGEGLLYGQDPTERLRAAVKSINAEHSDAEFVVLTGDITHFGTSAAYKTFKAEISKLSIPIHLMVGNHDKTPALIEIFPNVRCDHGGFVQTSFVTEQGKFLLLDTTLPGTHAGGYCDARREWLRVQLEITDGPVILFMHHPPFKVGIKAMDKIMMQDSEAFHDVLFPHKHQIRHLFFGHLHRPLSGNWQGISYSCLRGLNHQVALDLRAAEDAIIGNFEPPTYGVVLMNPETVIVHIHEFMDASGSFRL